MDKNSITKVPDYAARLLSAVAGSGDSMDRLARIGYEMLGNPLVVTDKSWTAITMTTAVDVPDDTEWNELLSTGRLSAESVTAGIRVKLADRIERSAEPFVWQGEGMKYPRLLCKISLSGKTAATISVIEYRRRFEDGDYTQLALLRDAFAAELQKNSYQRFTRGMIYEELIEHLLSGKLKDPDVVGERIKLLNIGIKKNVYVFVFDVVDYDPNNYSLTYMLGVLEKMISGGRALIYDNKIVIAASFTRARDIFKAELKNLGEFLKKHNIRCGISRRCTQLHELRFYYEQALSAMRIGTYLDGGRYIYPYGEYAVYHVAELCCESGGSKTYCHPALLTLIAYDGEYGTAFAASLYAYLSRFRSISRAAAALNLHRNTFVYHMKRVEEIMEIDLSDYKTAQLIELSFSILEYEKKLDFRPSRNDVIEEEN